MLLNPQHFKPRDRGDLVCRDVTRPQQDRLWATNINDCRLDTDITIATIQDEQRRIECAALKLADNMGGCCWTHATKTIGAGRGCPHHAQGRRRLQNRLRNRV